jgi:hypothetical protein
MSSNQPNVDWTFECADSVLPPSGLRISTSFVTRYELNYLDVECVNQVGFESALERPKFRIGVKRQTRLSFETFLDVLYCSFVILIQHHYTVMEACMLDGIFHHFLSAYYIDSNFSPHFLLGKN